MKRFFVIIFLLLCLTLSLQQSGADKAFGQGSPQQMKTTEQTAPKALPIAFAPEQLYRFDTVTDGKEIIHDFIIQNKGNAPLNIFKVKTP